MLRYFTGAATSSHLAVVPCVSERVGRRRKAIPLSRRALHWSAEGHRQDQCRINYRDAPPPPPPPPPFPGSRVWVGLVGHRVIALRWDTIWRLKRTIYCRHFGSDFHLYGTWVLIIRYNRLVRSCVSSPSARLAMLSWLPPFLFRARTALAALFLPSTDDCSEKAGQYFARISTRNRQWNWEQRMKNRDKPAGCSVKSPIIIIIIDNTNNYSIYITITRKMRGEAEAKAKWERVGGGREDDNIPIHSSKFVNSSLFELQSATTCLPFRSRAKRSTHPSPVGPGLWLAVGRCRDFEGVGSFGPLQAW